MHRAGLALGRMSQRSPQNQIHIRIGMLMVRTSALVALSIPSHVARPSFRRPLFPFPTPSSSLFSSFLFSSAMSPTSSKTTNLVWNKEENSYGDYGDIEIKRKAKIVSIAEMDDPANELLHKQPLPSGCELVKVLTSIDEIDLTALKDVNAIFCSHGMAREPLAYLLEHLPNIEWVHTRSAGIDFVHSKTLEQWNGGIMTNAKGQFSSTLAEYSMGAMTYFAKDFARLQKGKTAKAWDKYSVQELRGATVGIVGYGDIGKATARLAKAYWMKILALGRRLPEEDGIADERHDVSHLHHVLGRSDFVVCATPLTPSTKGFMGKAEFSAQKKGSVFINVGRGPTVDEPALIEALQSGHLKGAGLDVFCEEPLPPESPLWELDNVLLSPHNMDQTDTFMHESVEFYCKEQLPRFVRGLELYNRVDHKLGY